MNEHQIQAVEALLANFKESQVCIINEWSHREEEELKELDNTIDDYRRRILQD